MPVAVAPSATLPKSSVVGVTSRSEQQAGYTHCPPSHMPFRPQSASEVQGAVQYSSTWPSQSLSMASQSSSAPGCTVSSIGSQSSRQKPSPSASPSMGTHTPLSHSSHEPHSESSRQPVHTPSSTWPSQSLSRPSQISGAPG